VDKGIARFKAGLVDKYTAASLKGENAPLRHVTI
jgi:hypothetical protein